MKNLFLKKKSVLLIAAALFSANLTFAETGSETEKNATGGGSSNAQVDGQSYYVAGTYIAGTGSAQTGNMTSKGFKLRTGTDGKRAVFTVQQGYTITNLELTGASNYELNDGGTKDVSVIKVEVDGVEVGFTGGEAFKYRGGGESCTLNVDNIEATQSIAIYFDNGDSKGSQINASWVIDWERPDATQPTITVSPEAVALVPGATFKLTTRVDPSSFTTAWVSSNEAVATVAADGTVTAVAPGVANISNEWDQDATVAATAVVTVAEFDAEALTVVKSFDFKSMESATLTIESEAAGNIWNEANNKANAIYFLTNEGLEDIAVQAVESGGKGWKLVGGEGLVLASGAGRCAAIGHLTAGQIVEIIYTGSEFYTGSHSDAQRKDSGAEKTALNQGVGRAIYQMTEDGLLGFEITKGKAIEKIVVYEEGAVVYEPSEAYIAFDKSQLEGWSFPKTVATDTEITIPYNVTTYKGDLNNVVVSLKVNDEVVDTQEMDQIAFDEDWGEGDYVNRFTYTATEEGELKIQLLLSYDGSDLNEGENETEEVVITVDNNPVAPVLEGIAALKSYEAQGVENVVLSLADAKVTYVGTIETYDYNTWEEVEADVVVLEDATGGIMLQNSGLGTLIEKGQVLNGKIALSIESVWGEISATLTDGIEGLTVTDGEATPLLITDDNLFDFLGNPDWRYIELKDVTFKLVSGTYGDDLYLVSEQLGEIALQDVLGVIDLEELVGVEGAESVTGYVYSLYGGLVTAFQIVEITQTPEVATIAEFKATTGKVKLTLTDAQVNLVDEDYGIFIQDATGGLVIAELELDVEPGQKLSGTIVGQFDKSYGFASILPDEDEDGSNLTVAEGTLEVKVVTIEEAAEDANDLRLVEVTGIYFAEEFAMYGIIETPAIVDESEEPLFISDLFFVLDEDQEIEDDTEVTVTGFIRVDHTYESLLGTTALTIVPVNVGDENPLVVTSLNDVKTVLQNGAFYNLNGVRVDNPQKGIYIQNGKKVVVK
ncbi:MAG: Ig-like domain-containing protein [Prevotella sp.]|nr:Ig-like domain-containing protein [Prevotella sp.]